MIRTTTELFEIDDFRERFEYLSLRGSVAEETFGLYRWLNQSFYKSRVWQDARRFVILRDNGNDIGCYDHPIRGNVYVHHMNPLTVEQIEDYDDAIVDPEFLISVSHNTHNAIHYGDANLLPRPLVERGPGDTRLW